MTAGAPRRVKTVILDSLGLVAAVWSIPLAIVAVGMPVVLLFMAVRMVANLIW